MTSSLGDCLRCPHCLEELDYLEEPKQLSCSHIFCTPCLESLAIATDTGVKVTCSICCSHHSSGSLQCLPGAVFAESSDTNDKGSGDKAANVLYCDQCRGSDVNAVCYCVDCNKKLCSRHEKAHEDFFEDEHQKHQILSISVYASRPTSYKRKRCQTHEEEYYAMCCDGCYALACSQCENSGCTAKQAGKGQHTYRTLRETELRLKSEFEAVIKRCAAKITEMCKVEKETWIKLDQLEEDCQGLITQVEKKAAALISTIKDESDRVKLLIRAHEREGKDQVELHLQELRVTREELESLKRENAQFIQENNVLDIVRGRKERLEQVEAVSMSYDAGNFNIPATEILNDMLASYMQLDLRVHIVPTSLGLLSSHHTEGECYAVCFSKNGKLLVGCHDGIRIYSDSFNKPEKTLKSTWVTSIASRNLSSKTEFVFIRHETDDRVVCKASSDFSKQEEIVRFSLPGEDAAFLAASTRFISWICKKSLIVYDTITQKQTTEIFSFRPTLLRFDVEGKLLVSSFNGLHKYSIDNSGKIRLIWTCDDMEAPGGIAFTIYGDIVVQSSTHKQMYVVSPQGKILRILRNGFLSCGFVPIDIQGDVLIEPCWEQNCYKRYRIG